MTRRRSDPTRTRADRDWFWPAVGLVALVAAALRIGYTVSELWHSRLGDDASFYYNESALLAHGHFFVAPFLYMYSFGHTSIPAASHPPLFTLVLAAANRVGFDTEHSVRLLCCVIGAAAVVPVALLGRAVGGRRVGIIAAVLTALFVPRVLTDGTVFAEVLYASLVALFLLAMYRLLGNPTTRMALVAGILGALAALTRGEGLILVAVVSVVVVLGIATWRRRLVLLGTIALTSAVVIAPWTIYNLTRFNDPVFISTNGGQVLAGANCKMTYYGSHMGLWIFACPHAGDKALTGDDSQTSTGLRAQGLRYARQHLSRVPIVMAARIGRTFHLYRPLQSVEVDIGSGWRSKAALAAFEALTIVAMAGAYVLWKRDRKALLPFAGATLAVVITVAAFYGNFRFRIPVDVSFLVMGAVALDALWERVVAHRHVAAANPPVATPGVAT